MVEVTHLDSSLLRGMLDPEDESGKRTEATHLFNSSRGVRFRISILAVGEVMGKMAETRSATACADAAAHLSRLFRGRRLDLFGIGKDCEAMLLANELMEADHMLTPADALLVACALLDDECTTFATTDRRLSESIPLLAQAERSGLKILDARTHRSGRNTSQLGRTAHLCLRRATQPLSET